MLILFTIAKCPFIKGYTYHTEKELIHHWQQGDEKAFEKLYHLYAVDLLTFAVHKTNDRNISKELIQHVFLNLYQQKSTAHTIQSVKAFLYSILRRRIIDHYRKELAYNKLHYFPGLEPEVADTNHPQSQIETKELEWRLHAEISKLPPQCQHVFRLRKEQELSNKEIAQHLHISENTVEQHMRRALRLLRVGLNVGQKSFLVTLILRLMDQ